MYMSHEVEQRNNENVFILFFCSNTYVRNQQVACNALDWTCAANFVVSNRNRTASTKRSQSSDRHTGRQTEYRKYLSMPMRKNRE